MRETQMRVPLMQGLPKQTFGLIEIRSRQFCIRYINYTPL
jgi:hypothetical protein